jgi:predicted secreted protein
MSTQAIQGRKGRVFLSTDGGATYNQIGEVKNWEVGVQVDEIDATSHDSAGWKEKLLGLKEWHGTAEAFYVSSNAAQNSLFAAIAADQVLKFKFMANQASGADQWIGDGIVKSWKKASPNSDAAMVNLEISGSGQLVKSAQP